MSEKESKKWYEVLKGKIIDIESGTVMDYHPGAEFYKFIIFSLPYLLNSNLIETFKETIKDKDDKNLEFYALIIHSKSDAYITIRCYYPIFKISGGFHCGVYSNVQFKKLMQSSKNYDDFDSIDFPWGSEEIMDKLKKIAGKIDETKYVKRYIIKLEENEKMSHEERREVLELLKENK